MNANSLSVIDEGYDYCIMKIYNNFNDGIGFLEIYLENGEIKTNFEEDHGRLRNSS